MKSPTSCLALALTALLASGCLDDVGGDDQPELSETESEVIGANRIAANRIAANRIAANRIAANKLAASSLETRDLMDTSDGRDLMSFIVSCALPGSQSVTLQDTAGTSYTYQGWLNLAPAWATRAPNVTERRWVTSCLLARTNVFGVPVTISMRHDTYGPLLATAAEKTAYPKAEGAFFGDMFAPTSVLYACGNRTWAAYAANSFRACALASTGSTTTDCGFTYTGACTSTTCTDKVAPFGGCRGGTTTYNEVVSIFLTSTQQQGQTQ